MYILTVALLAYNFIPDASSDLTRYFELLDYYSTMSIREAIEATSNGLYVMTFLMWAISKTGCYGLMPMMTASAVYGVGAYITCDFAEQKGQCKMIPMLLLIQFFFLPLTNIFNNVRNVFAFALIILAVYRDIIKQKRNLLTIILYIAPIFMHTSAIVLVILRFIAPFVKQLKELFLVGVFFVSSLISYAINHISLVSWSRILTNAILKSERYSSDAYLETAWGAKVAGSLYFRLCYLMTMFFAVLIIILYFRILRSSELSEIRTDKNMQITGAEHPRGTILQWTIKALQAHETVFINYGFLIAITVLGCSVFNAPHYWRFAVALTLPLGAMLVVVMERYGDMEIILYRLLVGVAVISLFLWLWRIPWRSTLKEWMIRFLLNNPYRIIYEIIRNLI